MILVYLKAGEKLKLKLVKNYIIEKTETKKKKV
jgi:hypothetical protein